MTVPAAPDLATYLQSPTWLNRARRADRSACVELKASDLWRTVPQDDWHTHARRPQTHSHLIAQAPAVITAHQLADLHDGKPPFLLKGDHRTPKSNALKPASQTTAPQGPRLQAVEPKPTHSHHLYDTALGNRNANPNRGQSRTKMLGLPTDWSQTLTIQRWCLHERLAQHFFACPNCNQRALKLFLPLCTKEELRDALTAHLWLSANEKRIATSITLRPQASTLIARYGPLFPPRRLLCRKCLNLRYGDVRKPR